MITSVRSKKSKPIVRGHTQPPTNTSESEMSANGQSQVITPSCPLILQKSRLTVVSREAKKKQHARASSGLRDHYSELFTRMAALKF